MQLAEWSFASAKARVNLREETEGSTARRVMVDSLQPIFAELRERLLRASSGMDLAQDDPGNVILKTPWIEPGKKEPA